MKQLSILSRLVPALLVLLLAAPASGDGRVPGPVVSPAVKGDQCVEDTDVMRRRHMDFLKHQRDETMHRGIRTEQHSLKACLTCHVTPEQAYHGDSQEGHFCKNCHEYAAVKIDCFECHATQPERDQAGRVQGELGEGATRLLSHLARPETNETGASE